MNKNKSFALRNYLHLVKFSHTFFALPFALIGYYLAIYPKDIPFNWQKLVFVLLGVVFATNSAMSFNRVTDRFLDKRNPRKSNREIPSGKIHPRNAFIFSMINALLFIVTSFFINKLTFYLSPLALLVVLGYTYTKRFTILCHFVLGIALSLAPIGAYIAVTGKWALIPFLVSIVVFLWVSGFDIIYSIRDREFDKEELLRSIPAVMGIKAARIISFTLHSIAILIVIKIGYLLEAGSYYWIGAISFIGLLAIQQLFVNTCSERRIEFAFVTLNGISSIVYAVFTILSFYQ